MKKVIIHKRSYLMAITALMFLILVYGCPVLKPTPSPTPAPTSPPSPTTQTPTTPPWTDPPWIAGFIDDSSIGKTIQGVKVVATHQGYGIDFPSSNGYITGPDGSYVIVAPFAGTYNVVATHSSYNTYLFNEPVNTPNIEYRTDFSMTQSCSGDPVRVLGATSVVYQPTLASAFSAAANGDTVHSQNRTFIETLTCDKTISIVGGFDNCYSTVSGITQIQGNMTFTHATSTISNIAIQP